MQTILVIIRDWKARALLGAQLKEEGYQTYLVEDVKEALKALQAGQVHPGLVILDTLYQEVDTPILNRLHTEGGFIQNLVLKGGLDPIPSGSESGAFCHYLRRPVSIEAILDKVRQLLRLDKPDSFLYNN